MNTPENGAKKTPPVFVEPIDTPTEDWRYELRHGPLVAEEAPGEEFLFMEEETLFSTIPLNDALRPAIEEYLMDRHTILWGDKFVITSDEGRDRAINWILDLLDGIHEHMTQGEPEAQVP